METFAWITVAALAFTTGPNDPGPKKGPEGEDDRLQFYGNARLRAESTFDQPNGEDRHRGRMRARVGARYKVADDLMAEGRLSTSSDGNDANNPHWDFGDGADAFEGGDIVFDRLFLKWTPGDFDVRAGKMEDALQRPPVYSELSWDNDVSPTGVAGRWTHALSEGAKLDLRLVDYVAVENGSDDDSNYFAAQAGVNLNTGGGWHFDLAASYGMWSSLDAGATVFGNQGNTDVTGEFDLLEGFVAATYDDTPLGKATAFVQVMQNTGSDVDEDFGIAGGAKLGRSGNEGDLNGFLVYYDLDADSVFSPVAQDDTPIAGTGVGTGMSGIIGGFQYYWKKNVTLKLWALTSDADAADDPFRVRFDIDINVI